MKKLLSLFLAVAIAALSRGLTVYAEETYSGKCGDDLHWSYSKSKQKLVIIGDGDMWDFQSESEVPWSNLKDGIRYLTLANRINNLHWSDEKALSTPVKKGR